MRFVSPFLLLSLTTFAADWPQWRGPNRDGISSETGLAASWPTNGPPLVWKVKGLGQGYSSLAISKGRIYTQGQRDGKEWLIALDVKNGNKLWEVPTGSPYSNDRGDGPRGTPMVDGDRVYAINGTGVLVCLDAATGKAHWTQDFVRDYGGSIPHWGYSESPLIDGNRLIVMPGGRGASIVSLDKVTGKVQWKAGSDSAGYSSAIVADIGGVRQVIALSGQGALGVQENTGEVLWHYDKVSNRTANIATPIYHNGAVFVSTAYGTGAALLKVGPKNMTEAYFNRDMMNHYSSSVLVNNTLYGFSNAILMAMDFDTGKVLWRDRSVGKGSVIFAQGNLYALGEDGVMGLVRANRDKYQEISRFSFQKGGLPTWSPPVISDAKLYLRDQDNLYCHDIKAK
jgi:outer membrane protein assembly factor BamB